VVCSFGRNNVPLCQDDGTWTDIPRCIEHDPGVEDQIPGLCPAIPGYCSTNFPHGSCKFDCPTGEDISSVCTADGTWAPYPTCEGDLRETRDGCDGCPGTVGGKRNRTAEAILGTHMSEDSRRVPKLITNGGGRKTVPSFAGNINIGLIGAEEGSNKNNQIKSFQQSKGQRKPTLKFGPRITKSESPRKTITQTRKFKQIQPPQTFGVFEAVNLGALSGDRPQGKPISQNLKNEQNRLETENFFGVFESVNL